MQSFEYEWRDDGGYCETVVKWDIDYTVHRVPGDYDTPGTLEIEIKAKTLLSVTVWIGDYGHELPLKDSYVGSRNWLESRLDDELLEDAAFAHWESLDEEGKAAA